MKLVGDYKKVLLVGGIVLISAAGGALAFHPKVSANFDLPGLNQQVQNHEARIINTESDVKALQDNTKTAPAANPVSVPVVTATSVAPSPTPSPTPPAPPVAPAAPVAKLIKMTDECVNGRDVFTYYWDNDTTTTQTGGSCLFITSPSDGKPTTNTTLSH